MGSHSSSIKGSCNHWLTELMKLSEEVFFHFLGRLRNHAPRACSKQSIEAEKLIFSAFRLSLSLFPLTASLLFHFHLQRPAALPSPSQNLLLEIMISLMTISQQHTESPLRVFTFKDFFFPVEKSKVLFSLKTNFKNGQLDKLQLCIHSLCELRGPAHKLLPLLSLLILIFYGLLLQLEKVSELSPVS